MRPSLLDVPGVGPPGHADQVGERSEAGGERPERRAAVAEVAVGGDREVHRPDEHGAVLSLKVLVEAEVEPEPAADPHQAQLLVLAHRRAVGDEAFDLLVERSGGVARPFGAAVPLRQHHGRDAVDDVERRRARGREQVARAPAPLLLLVGELEHLDEPPLVEALAGQVLEERDEPLELRRHQVESGGADDRLPVSRDPLPPEVGQPVLDALLEREVRHAPLALPGLGDPEMRVRPDLRQEDGDVGQAAPGRLLGIVLERRAERDRAVLLDVVGVAALAQQREIVRRALLGRADRGPPLVDDVRDVHRAQKLMRDVGIDDRQRLAGCDAELQVGEPLALMARGRRRGLEPFRAARAHARVELRCVLGARPALLCGDEPDAAGVERASQGGKPPGERVVAGADPGDDDVGAGGFGLAGDVLGACGRLVADRGRRAGSIARRDRGQRVAVFVDEPVGERLAPVVVLADDHRAVALDRAVEIERVVAASGHVDAPQGRHGRVVLGEKLLEQGVRLGRGEHRRRADHRERRRSREARGRVAPKLGELRQQRARAVGLADCRPEALVGDRLPGPALQNGDELAEAAEVVVRRRLGRQVQQVDEPELGQVGSRETAERVVEPHRAVRVVRRGAGSRSAAPRGAGPQGCAGSADRPAARESTRREDRRARFRGAAPAASPAASTSSRGMSAPT